METERVLEKIAVKTAEEHQKYREQLTKEFFNKVEENLPRDMTDDTMLRWIMNEEGILNIVSRFYRRPSNGRKIFEELDVVETGTKLKTFYDFLREHDNQGLEIGPLYKNVLSDNKNRGVLNVAAENTKVSLVVVSLAEIGLNNGATTQEICASAEENGLSFCSPEIILLLSLKRLYQWGSEKLFFVAKPMLCASGHPYIPYISDNYTYRAVPRLDCFLDGCYPWSKADCFVFVSR